MMTLNKPPRFFTNNKLPSKWCKRSRKTTPKSTISTSTWTELSIRVHTLKMVPNLKVKMKFLRISTSTRTRLWGLCVRSAVSIWLLMEWPHALKWINKGRVDLELPKTLSSRKSERRKWRPNGKTRFSLTRGKRTSGTLIQMWSLRAPNSCIDFQLHSRDMWSRDSTLTVCGTGSKLCFRMRLCPAKENTKFWISLDPKEHRLILTQTQDTAFTGQTLIWSCLVWPLMRPTFSSSESALCGLMTKSAINVVNKVIPWKSVELGTQKTTHDWQRPPNFNLSKFRWFVNILPSNSKHWTFLSDGTWRNSSTILCSCVSWSAMTSCPIYRRYRLEKELSTPYLWCTRMLCQVWTGIWPTLARLISQIVMCYSEI